MGLTQEVDPRIDTVRGDLTVKRPFRAEFRERDRAWVVVDAGGHPFAFCLSEKDAKAIEAAGKEQGQ